MPELTDHELMLLVGAGEPQQLAELFARHHRKMYNFFRKLGNSVPASEDLVQESFMRMLKYAGTYKPSGRFITWMYQIARNTAADNFGSTDFEDISEEAVLAQIPPHTLDDPEQLHDTSEINCQLQRALLRLPHDKRELILLSRIRELGNDDLAKLFACSPTVIKVRLHRSLHLLREYFDQERQNNYQ